MRDHFGLGLINEVIGNLEDYFGLGLSFGKCKWIAKHESD
jgi:hypothetical protein